LVKEVLLALHKDIAGVVDNTKKKIDNKRQPQVSRRMIRDETTNARAIKTNITVKKKLNCGDKSKQPKIRFGFVKQSLKTIFNYNVILLISTVVPKQR